MTAPYNPYGLDQYTASWFARYAGSYAGTISGGTSEIQRNIIAQQVLGPAAGLTSSLNGRTIPPRCLRFSARIRRPPVSAGIGPSGGRCSPIFKMA